MYILSTPFNGKLKQVWDLCMKVHRDEIPATKVIYAVLTWKCIAQMGRPKNSQEAHKNIHTHEKLQSFT